MNGHVRTPFEHIARRVDPQAQLRHAAPLLGGSAAEVHLLELALPDGRAEKVVVRQHGAADRAQNPHIAADEFRLLSRLQAHGVAAPRPYFADETNRILSTPYIVVQFVEGAPEAYPATVPDFAQPVAAALRRVHAAAPAAFAFLPHAAEHLRHKLAHPPPELDETLQEGHVRALLNAHLALLEERPLALLHGDFWSGNLIWQHGRLAAIIDWEDACLGNPLADVGNARLELLWKFGVEHMTAFTEAYRQHDPFAPVVLAFWDLAAALRAAHKLSAWGLDAVTEQRMIVQHREFVVQAQRVFAAP